MEMTVETSKARSSVVPMAVVAMLFFCAGFCYLAQWLFNAIFKADAATDPFAGITGGVFILYSRDFYGFAIGMADPRVGYKNGMALGMAVMMLAGLLYIPAAQTQTFGLFLLAQLVIGAGQTLLQTAVNPYVVKIGPEEDGGSAYQHYGYPE